MARKSDNYKQYTIGKISRIKQRTKTSKKRKGFVGVRRELLNYINKGISLSTVKNESKNDNLCVHDQSGSTTATTTFAKSNETFSVSQTLSVSSSKVEDIEEESLKRKESISGNCIINGNIRNDVFVEMFYALCVKVVN